MITFMKQKYTALRNFFEERREQHEHKSLQKQIIKNAKFSSKLSVPSKLKNKATSRNSNEVFPPKVGHVSEDSTPKNKDLSSELTEKTERIYEEISPETENIYEEISPEKMHIYENLSPQKEHIYENVSAASEHNFLPLTEENSGIHQSTNYSAQQLMNDIKSTSWTDREFYNFKKALIFHKQNDLENERIDTRINIKKTAQKRTALPKDEYKNRMEKFNKLLKEQNHHLKRISKYKKNLKQNENRIVKSEMKLR